ncbi:MAG TPA: C1 family peptidase [Saprospiraceae bacterium]|nr:C1 family peptidase [Saprospiraceae bacterium]
MQKLLLSLLFAVFATALFAQKQEPYEFKEIKQLKATPVKNQDKTGTCWAFSCASFLESEALRLGKSEANLSEMFVVRHIYRQKCENYVRRQGTAQLGEGGLAHDLLNAVKQFGIAPESAYPGRKDPNKPFDHNQLEKNLKNMCEEFVTQGKAGKLSEKWLSKVDSVLDMEFGAVPQTFTVDNTVFTPVSYRDFLGIKPDDYVSISSFSHHPFYEKFILEVPDNWANGQFYNLPISELMRCLNYALQQGYSVEWDADVSNTGFSAGNGIAIVPEKDWKDRSSAERQNAFKVWEAEKTVSQEYRQQQFDKQVTTDDHLMHIVGMLDEAHGGDFYAVKNSWGEISDLKGYVNVSESYMRLNTISFTVHKNALPADVLKRLGIVPEPTSTTGMTTRPTTPTSTNKVESTVSPARIQPKASSVAPKATPQKSGSATGN